MSADVTWMVRQTRCNVNAHGGGGGWRAWRGVTGARIEFMRKRSYMYHGRSYNVQYKSSQVYT